MNQGNNDHNPQSALIAGESATGKSMSLRNIRNPEGVAYLNCEGKPLPFRSSFKEVRITDPWDIAPFFERAENNKDIHTIVIDSVTFMMDMMETLHVNNPPKNAEGKPDTFKGWANYKEVFSALMHKHVNPSRLSVIMLAHTRDNMDKDEQILKTNVPIKGALKNMGIEAFFTTVVYTRKMSLAKLDDYKNDMLIYNEDDEELGFKHVFQTRITRDTIGSTIRSPDGLFGKKETFINNDVQILLDHLQRFYSPDHQEKPNAKS